MKKLHLALVLLAVPLMLAAVFAAGGYVWSTFASAPQAVHADGAGVDSKDGYTITTLHDGDREYLVVSAYAPYAGDKVEKGNEGKMRHFLSLYEVHHKDVGKADLTLVCSRCIEWDRGFELLNLKDDGQRPSVLKRKLEK